MVVRPVWIENYFIWVNWSASLGKPCDAEQIFQSAPHKHYLKICTLSSGRRLRTDKAKHTLQVRNHSPHWTYVSHPPAGTAFLIYTWLSWSFYHFPWGCWKPNQNSSAVTVLLLNAGPARQTRQNFCRCGNFFFHLSQTVCLTQNCL